MWMKRKPRYEVVELDDKGNAAGVALIPEEMLDVKKFIKTSTERGKLLAEELKSRGVRI